jgi:phenylacetate-CoA ligase
MIGAQLVTPPTQNKPPFWVWNSGLNQLYMSAYHLAPDCLGHYLDAIAEHQVEYLWGHSSALHILAREVLRSGRRDLKLKVALSSSEPLNRRQRQAISAAFQCPARETYGMSEMVAGASECESGHLHLWPEAGYYEVVDGLSAVAPGTAGDLIATCLLNWEMPLIRYRVGDRVVMSSSQEGCVCGRTLPVLTGIEGRSSDILYTPDGRQLSPSSMEIVFDIDLPIMEAQIVQEEIDRIRVRYVPADGFSLDSGRTLQSRITERMGDVQVILEQVGRIERGANGKFRAVLCKLSEEQIKQALRMYSATQGAVLSCDSGL